MKRKGEKTVGQFVNKMKIFLKNVFAYYPIF
jgi:hypothetical protein